MKQRHEIRDDIINMVRDEHLVAIQGNLVPFDGDTVLDLREIKDSGQVERIIHIQMDIEKRLIVHRIQGPVELLVILVLKL